jgi:hypothetical protein
MSPQRVADQFDFNFILEGMRLLEVLVIFRRGFESLGLDVLALHEQKALHAWQVTGKTGTRPFHNRDHDRKRFQRDEKSEVSLGDVIDVLVFSDRSARDDENRGAFHWSNVWSALTSLASFSRPWDATRMWY